MLSSHAMYHAILNDHSNSCARRISHWRALTRCHNAAYLLLLRSQIHQCCTVDQNIDRQYIDCLRFIGCLRFIDCLHTQMSSASYTVRALLYVGLVRCIICVLLSLRYLPPVYCDAPPTGACKYVCALRTIIGSLSIVESKSRSW